MRHYNQIELSFHRLESTKLDDFSYDNSRNDVYVLQNDIYRFNDKWKKRGIGNLGSKEIEHLEIFERDGKLYYRFKMNRSNRLRSSIISNKIKDIGKYNQSLEKSILIQITRDFGLKL